MNSAPVARGEGQVFPASRPLIPYQGPLSYPGNLRVNRPRAPGRRSGTDGPAAACRYRAGTGGGELDAGPQRNGGYRVNARLPARLDTRKEGRSRPDGAAAVRWAAARASVAWTFADYLPLPAKPTPTAEPVCGRVCLLLGRPLEPRGDGSRGGSRKRTSLLPAEAVDHQRGRGQADHRSAGNRQAASGHMDPPAPVR